MFEDWISEAVGGLSSLFGDGGSEFVGDLAVDLGGDYYGPAGTINLPLADGMYGPAGTVSVPGGGIPYDQIPNYGSYPGDIYDGSRGSGPGGSLPGGGGQSDTLADALRNLARSGGSGGGGNLFSMPKIDAGGAASVSAHPVSPMQTGAIPNTPPPSSEFRPMTLETPRRGPDLRGLEKLFSRGA